jgi:hypothetical protein
MKYEDIMDFTQRCETHPDHQSGMISYAMITTRLHEEVSELREFIEKTLIEVNELQRTAKGDKRLIELLYQKIYKLHKKLEDINE